MSDTAAFFAKKKTKKKKFKAFNANKIDAATVTSAAHVDAPEISASAEGVTNSLGGLELGGGDDQWADSQVAWGSNNKAPAASGGDSKVAELLDMQSLQERRNAEDNVAERLRIEETKAQLAKAKEGMAKEAERLAAEKEAKEFKVSNRSRPSPGLGGGGAGGKWVPSHMRSAGGGLGGMGGSGMRGPASMESTTFQKSVDVASEELFPDLANADKILADKERMEKMEADRIAASQPARAPAGWGSRMAPGSASAAPAQRKPLNLAPAPAERKPLNLAKKEEQEAEPVAEKKEEPEVKKEEEKAAEAPAPAAEALSPAAEAPKAAEKPKEKKVLKKKKKKDLSTFKAKS